jgi:hypothetical protein
MKPVEQLKSEARQLAELILSEPPKRSSLEEKVRAHRKAHRKLRKGIAGP